MAFKFNRSRNEPMSEINVTPFVDVMLVLLIIFMVSHSDLKLWSMTIYTHDSPIVMAHHNSQQPN